MNPLENLRTRSRKDVSELGWIEREKVCKELLEEGIRWAEIYRAIAMATNAREFNGENVWTISKLDVDGEASELFQRRTK